MTTRAPGVWGHAWGGSWSRMFVNLVKQRLGVDVIWAATFGEYVWTLKLVHSDVFFRYPIQANPVGSTTKIYLESGRFWPRTALTTIPIQAAIVSSPGCYNSLVTLSSYFHRRCTPLHSRLRLFSTQCPFKPNVGCHSSAEKSSRASQLTLTKIHHPYSVPQRALHRLRVRPLSLWLILPQRHWRPRWFSVTSGILPPRGFGSRSLCSKDTFSSQTHSSLPHFLQNSAPVPLYLKESSLMSVY